MRAAVLLIAWILASGSIQGAEFRRIVLYSNSFEQVSPGPLPPEFLVLDGAFEVKATATNRFLELPGAPLDLFTVQFGPTGTTNLAASARIRATGKGRRTPTFGVGLGGVTGYRLQITPAKNRIELFQDKELRADAPFDWVSGKWLWLRLSIVSRKGPHATIEGRAWLEGAVEPAKPQILFEVSDTPGPGRASVFGSPYSGTPVGFDDLRLELMIEQ